MPRQDGSPPATVRDSAAAAPAGTYQHKMGEELWTMFTFHENGAGEFFIVATDTGSIEGKFSWRMASPKVVAIKIAHSPEIPAFIFEGGELVARTNVLFHIKAGWRFQKAPNP